MSGCPADHTTRTIGARCSLCGAPMTRDLRGTLQRKGTTGYQDHVQTEQRGMIAHLEQLGGRTLTPAERAEVSESVSEAIARFSR